MENIPEEVQKNLKKVLDHFDREEYAVRQRQLAVWRKLKLYWNTFQNTWWSTTAHDWRVWDREYSADDNAQYNAYYDRPINVFRALLESIIAALSVQIPSIKCYPDDADNPLDITTAKAGDRISDLIDKHNDAPLLWLHALYVFVTEGLLACYNYTKEDESYGTYTEDKYEDQEIQAYQCSQCGAQLDDEMFTNQEKDEFDPDHDDVDIQNLIQNKGETVCPQCGMLLDPELQKTPLIVTRITGTTTKPKTRQCLEVYGGLYVKVPNYAMCQKDIPYLIFSYETHYSAAIEMYPDLRDDINGGGKIRGGAGTNQDYERWARLSPQYNGEFPINTVTIRNGWLRPEAFNVLPEEDCKDLKKRFPNGSKVVFVNEEFAEACNECLDDHWTLTKNPSSDYLHHEPLGLLLVSIQDITNDLVSLTLQTIEHGIPQTFTDPSVVDFDAYGQTEATPGGIYPAKPKAGKNLGDSFYEVKTATLSGEVLPFAQKTQEFGQFVSGALPSLFGGSMSQGKTASEYAMSRSQALQRLGTTWKMLSLWWKEVHAKAIPAFIKDMAVDEKMVNKNEQGNFINVFIRKAELQGQIGSIELEASEQLPSTWAQKKEVIMQLLQTGNPFILEALAAPENLPFIADAIGLDEFRVPGEADRQKQYEEIKELLDNQPIPDLNPMTQQQSEVPSVEVDPILDNHQVEADICRSWAISDAGRQAKIDNPNGYKNVLLHMKQHLDIIAQQVMQQQQPMMESQAQGASMRTPSKPKENTKTPIQGEQNVSTIQ